MSTHNRAVDHGVFVVGLLRQVLKHLLPDPARRPAAEPGMDRFPETKALGQVPPRNAGPVAVQHGFDKQSVVFRGHPDLAFAARQQALDPLPLLIPQRVTAHPRLSPPGQQFLTQEFLN